MWWKKNKWKVILPVLIAAMLAGAFYFGGNAPGARGWSTPSTPTPEPAQAVMANAADLPVTSPVETALSGSAAPTENPDPTVAPSQEPEATGTPKPAPTPAPTPAETPAPTTEGNPQTVRDKYLTDPVPSGKPLPVEPQDVVIGATAYTCTLSISCSTILDNMDLCDPEKTELVPEDGWILQPTAVTFYDSESVFNVLQRTCKQLGIQLEFENTPIYNSAYIEGIHNLYEFDVGELSGWMYKVNSWFPNYGCSRYQLKDGDVINWVYTCDLGYDVGGGYAVGG